MPFPFRVQEQADSGKTPARWRGRPAIDLLAPLPEHSQNPQPAGNLAVQRLYRAGSIHAKLTVSQPHDPDEQEADRIADQVMRMPEPRSAVPCAICADGEQPCSTCSSAPTIRRKARNAAGGMARSGTPLRHLGSGQPLDRGTRSFFEPRFGADLSHVRVHTGEAAADSASSIDARAFTCGRDIVLGAGEYAPESREGGTLLAHEIAHVLQPTPTGRIVLRRETTQEVVSRHEDWGGLNLNEEALAAELVGMARAARYTFVVDVLNALSSSDRDDVAGAMMVLFSTTELIRMARNGVAVEMLRRMKEELGDSWGWISEEEGGQVDLLGAVLNDAGKRDIWNSQRIKTLKGEGSTDLEMLARIFEDEQMIDDGTVSSRLAAILGATEHLVIPGLQTGIDFSDTGFAGDRESGGAGFRDPHPASRNQVGHFLTAIGLQFSPEVISRPIPFFGTIRGMVHAPESMTDAEVALRLTIGHEKAPDPDGTMAAVNVVLAGLIADLGPAPKDETEAQHDERVGHTIVKEARRQMDEIISAFRTQFQATTDADVMAWNEAIGGVGNGMAFDIHAAEAPLRRISIDPAGRGNSIQDLRLSLVGWRLGQLISAGAFANGHAVAAWIRTNLGATE